MGLFLLLNVSQYSQALPIVIFFSSVMSVLYYLGVMQWIITKVKVKNIQSSIHLTYETFKICCLNGCINNVFLCAKISWVMQVTMGTSSTETLSVAGNIFVGQVIFFHHSYNVRNYLKI